MKVYKQLLLSNQAWASELKEENEAYFQRLTAGQRPHFLWIGCSDSRVGPEQMTMSPPGGLFTHRNVANLVSADDDNLMAVVHYAVGALEVEHIILCGHYGCGGIQAALDGGTTGPIDRWLGLARAVADDHRAELDALPRNERAARLVELNVRDQLLTLARVPVVAAARAAGTLSLHGWVYDLRDGVIKPLLELEPGDATNGVRVPERVL